MNDRKPIGRKLRFEVFKRDGFACQYCGAKAPDVVLQIDHIKSVHEGGDNHLMNLITSCATCNGGKGAVALDDDSVVSKQMRQLEELNERRLQIEMIMEWRNDLLSIDKLKVDKIVEVISSKSEWSPNDKGREDIEKWVKKFAFEELLSAVDDSFRVYFKGDTESWNQAFLKIPGVITITRASIEKPYLRQLFYIRGILRKRFRYVNERDVMNLLERMAEANCDLDHLERLVKGMRTWTQFENTANDFLEKSEPADGKNS